MQETKPKLLIKKYRSVLIAATIVEVVSYVVSLTDSVVAANKVGMDALSAIGLLTPFFSISNFFAAVINSGTIKNYSYELGRFDKKRAGEFFGQGVISAVGIGVLMVAVMLIGRPLIYATMTPTAEILPYLNQYYTIIVFYFMMGPISALLDNIVVSDGGERLSAAANVFQIVSNIALSLFLAGKFGVIGIASATVISKAAFIVLISTWFFRKKRTVQFVFHFTFSDLWKIIRKGGVRASTYLTTALMTWILNAFIINRFDATTFSVWVIVQKLWGLSTLFLGLTMSVQSMFGILLGEKNTKAIKALLKILYRDMFISGLISAGLVFFFTAGILHVFDIREGDVFNQGMDALRIMSMALIFLSQMVLLFMYYFMIDKFRLALFVGIIKDFVCPVGMVVFFGMILKGSPYSLWIGLVSSQIAAMIITLVVVITRYGRDIFPSLMPKEQDRKIHIYAFNINHENAVSMSETCDALLKEEGYSKKIRLLLGVCIEDLLNYIYLSNNENNRLLAECTLITEENGVRLIMRDNGEITDFHEEDMNEYSFVQYIVSRVNSVSEYSKYVTTMGYNRNECFFADEQKKNRED